MKKLVAIALIAALATVANAGVAFVTSDGVTDVEAGDSVTVQLKADSVMGGGFGIGVLSDNGADGAMSNLAIGTAGTGFTIVEAGEILNTASTASGVGALLYGYSAYVNSNYPAGSVIFSFTYTVPLTAAPGDIVIAPLPAGTFYVYSDGEAYNDNAASYANVLVGTTPTDVAIDGLTLTVIPEPMTLGLLGLGGLFLRRRLA